MDATSGGFVGSNEWHRPAPRCGCQPLREVMIPERGCGQIAPEKRSGFGEDRLQRTPRYLLKRWGMGGWLVRVGSVTASWCFRRH